MIMNDVRGVQGKGAVDEVRNGSEVALNKGERE